jgi:hypothetical protein
MGFAVTRDSGVGCSWWQVMAPLARDAASVRCLEVVFGPQRVGIGKVAAGWVL